MDILHFLVLNYSFNLFYLFILVMRNNIMIVDPSFFFGVDLSFWLQGIYELIHKTDTQLQAIYALFFILCLYFQL